MNLPEAISPAEQGQQPYQNAETQTVNDQAAATIQAKLYAASTAISSEQPAQSSVAAGFNGALDALVEAAQAARIPAPREPDFHRHLEEQARGRNPISCLDIASANP